MNYLRLFLLCCVFIVSLVAPPSHACTTFCLDSNDDLVVGKNYDERLGDGLVIMNKRNVSKIAWLNPYSAETQPVTWTSKYGSVTFNPWGREFPESGINEAGLVVNLLWEPTATEYPAPDERPAIRSNQWIQYQLDNAATVADVIASDLEIRILNTGGPMHFFVCDSTGNCAIFEFIDGELVCYTQETMPVKVLVNTTYERCIEYWEKDEIPAPDYPYDAVRRFITAGKMLEGYDPETSGPAVDYAFNVLTNVAGLTQWSIAYDIPDRRVYFYTRNNKNLRYIDLNACNFSCLTPVGVLDVTEDLSGDVSGNFIDYTYELNRDLIEKTLHTETIPEFTEEVRESLAQYPETFECAGACELYIRHRKIRSSKLVKPRRVVLKISGDDDFDMYAPIDLGPLTWRKKSFNRKKNRLKIKAIVPAGVIIGCSQTKRPSGKPARSCPKEIILFPPQLFIFGEGYWIMWNDSNFINRKKGS